MHAAHPFRALLFRTGPLTIPLLLAACATPEPPLTLPPAQAVVDATPAAPGALEALHAFRLHVTLDRTTCRWQVPEDSYRCEIRHRLALPPGATYEPVMVLPGETGGQLDHARVIIRAGQPAPRSTAEPDGWTVPVTQVLTLARADTRQPWLSGMTLDLLLLGRVTSP
jgi:hypothetical protein